MAEVWESFCSGVLEDRGISGWAQLEGVFNISIKRKFRMIGMKMKTLYCKEAV